MSEHFLKVYQYTVNSNMHWLFIISVFFWTIEIVNPWRQKQPKIRQDFWLDGFYMFFNLYIVPVIGLNLLAGFVFKSFTFITSLAGIKSLTIINLGFLPWIIQFMVFFLFRDFIHYSIHRLIHRVQFLWEFHKVHHSVKQMGFAAHLRYHWVEGATYRALEFIPLAFLGIGITDLTLLYTISLAIGHSNHTNYYLPLGPLKYIVNNPQMHIWHHTKSMPKPYGANFGLSLSIWDYLFKTAYLPKNGRDNELGFDTDERFPKRFITQFIYPIRVREGKVKN